MSDKVNVLLVDDQPAKLLATETILRDLGENLIKALIRFSPRSRNIVSVANSFAG